MDSKQEIDYSGYLKEAHKLVSAFVDKTEKFMKEEYKVEIDKTKLLHYIDSSINKTKKSEKSNTEAKVCQGETRKGEKCTGKAKQGSDYCNKHNKNEKIPVIEKPKSKETPKSKVTSKKVASKKVASKKDDGMERLREYKKEKEKKEEEEEEVEREEEEEVEEAVEKTNKIDSLKNSKKPKLMDQ